MKERAHTYSTPSMEETTEMPYSAEAIQETAETNDESQVVAGATVTKTATVVGNGSSYHVAVRKQPNLQADALGVVPVGSKVTIYNKIDGFYRISTPTIKEAYIVASLLKED